MINLNNIRHTQGGRILGTFLSASLLIGLVSGLSACADLDNQFSINASSEDDSLGLTKGFKAREFGLASILLSDTFRKRVYIGDADHDFIHFAEPNSLAISDSVFVGGAPTDMWMDVNGRYLHAELAELQRVAVIDVERSKLLEYRDISEYRRGGLASRFVAQRLP